MTAASPSVGRVAAPRGAASIAVVGAVAVALGVFFPVLGVSLLLFLLGDLVRQQVRPLRPVGR